MGYTNWSERWLPNLGGLRYSEKQRQVFELQAQESESQVTQNIADWPKKRGQRPLSAAFWSIFDHTIRNFPQPDETTPSYHLLHPLLALNSDFRTPASSRLLYNLRENTPVEFDFDGTYLGRFPLQYRFLLLPETITSTEQWAKIRKELFFDPQRSSPDRQLLDNGNLLWDSWEFKHWQKMTINQNPLVCYWSSHEKALQPDSQPRPTSPAGTRLPQPVR